MTRASRRTIASWALMLALFAALHVVLALWDGYDEYWAVGSDVYSVYDGWIADWQRTGALVGIDLPSVYPFLALAPMIASAAFGTDPAAYFTTWMVLVLALDLGALVLIARRRLTLGWWWVGFTALLGPVAPARLDAVALAVAIPGVLLVAERPAVASAIFTVAAWIKIWPAAMVLAVVVAARRVGRPVLAAAAVSAAVIAIALACGSGAQVFSFITAQTGRGIQVEAPAALPWLWADALTSGRPLAYYDPVLLTRQVRGPGASIAAAFMTPVQALTVLLVVGAALLARRRRAADGPILALTALGLVSALVAFNKVGSPQYLTWFVAPILLGLLVDRQRFRVPAVAGLVLAGLTQLVYPWLYVGLIQAVPAVIAVLTVRDALEIVLFAWALVGLVRLLPESTVRGPARLREGVATA